MIAIDEIESTIKRLNLLKDNTDSQEEQFIADQLIQNLSMMTFQIKKLVEQPNFKEIVAQNPPNK